MLKRFVFFCLLFSFLTTQPNQWTWLFTKKFNTAESQANKKRSALIFCKQDIMLFNQLIFSWNAFKPSQGYFSFYAQVRDAQSKKWHDWHKMIDWGKDIAQSYCTKGSKTEYHHVRLEVPMNELANGLRIKIIANNGADLSLFHSLAVNVSDMAKFVPNEHSLCTQFPTRIISNIPQQSQMILDHPRAEHMCSPTSCSMLVSYLSKKTINALDFAQNVYDQGLDSFGSWPFNIAHAFEQCQGGVFFHVTRLNSFADLYAKLQQSIPVVVSVRGPLEGAPREYKNGHLLLVIGWDQKTKKVICHDPAFASNQEVVTYYDIESFCAAWARSHHLAYLAEFA